MDQLHQSGPPSGQRFRIGAHILFDPSKRYLWRVGRPDRRLAVEPAHAAVLEKLVQRPRTVLRWDQLVSPQWRTWGVTADTNGVAQAVHALRDVFLQLDPDTAYLHGLPRLGYALLADVRPEPGERASV